MKIENCMHPLLKERDQTAICQKLQAAMKAQKVDYLLILSAENIFYATGYMSVHSYDSGVPGITVALVPSEGEASLLINNFELESARAQTSHIQVQTYPSWAFIDDGSPIKGDNLRVEMEAYAAARIALGIIKETPDAVVGTERAFLPADLWNIMKEQIAPENIVDCHTILMQARMIKTPWEINMLRKAAAISEQAMYTAASQARAGMTLAELEKLMHLAGYQLDEEGTIVGSNFIISGGSQYGLSRLPRHYILKDGDIVRMDGGFMHLGYISDLARTFVIGTPSSEQARLYQALYKGFEAGIQVLGPHVPMSEIYHAVRSAIEASGSLPVYPRGHVGHSIGISRTLEEYPQFSAAQNLTLEPGMVISLETPYYGTQEAAVTGGFNIEDSFVITETGAERLTHANKELVWPDHN